MAWKKLYDFNTIVRKNTIDARITIIIINSFEVLQNFDIVIESQLNLLNFVKSKLQKLYRFLGILSLIYWIGINDIETSITILVSEL